MVISKRVDNIIITGAVMQLVMVLKGVENVILNFGKADFGFIDIIYFGILHINSKNPNPAPLGCLYFLRRNQAETL